MQTLFLTRYSYFGKSDWRSNASNDPELLLNPARLEQRERLFEKIALRSLQDQTDPDFKLVVLSSQGMPTAYKKRLVELCADTLGARAEVLFRAPRRTAGCFNEHRQSSIPATGKYIIQTILDDDDGVATNFVARIKAEADVATQTFTNERDYTFISHATGVNLKLDKHGNAEVTHRNIPCTAQGLTLVAPAASDRSPFNVAHKKILERRPLRILAGGAAMYVRTVHNLNDSRAMVGNDLVEPDMLERITREQLPMLAQFITPARIREKVFA